MPGTIERNTSNLHDADTGEMVGYKNPVTGKEMPVNSTAVQALVSRAGDLRRTVVPFKIWGLFQNSAGVRDQTLHATYEVPFDWIAVRLHVENMAATAQINCLCAVAVSNDGTVAPTVPSGAWNNVLFGGTALHATTACTVGAGTNDAVPTDLVSDWLTLPSIPRTDGGTGRILMVRQFVPLAGNTTGNRAPDVSSLSLGLGVTRLKTWFRSGDCVTTPASFTAPTEWTMAPAIWFEFLTAAGQVVLLAAGDSITQGADSSPIINVGGAARLTMEANQATVALCNQGWTSSTSAAYYANGLLKLTATRPSIAALCPWSPNDSDKYTQAGVDRCIRQAMQWVDACQRADAVPALVTPAPVNGLTAGEEGFRRQVVAAVKAICAGGSALLIDRDAVFTDYSSASGGFKSGLNATTLHPNGTGYAQEAASVWAPAVTAIR